MSKKRLREAVLAHLKQQGGPLRPNESGVTRLKALGLSNGSAQRVLDELSDVRLETLDQLAAGLKVKPWQLLAPSDDEVRPTADGPLTQELLGKLATIDGATLLTVENVARAVVGLPPVAAQESKAA